MIQVDFIIKNKVTEEQFEDIVEEWLSGGDYTPDDIIENIITEKNSDLLPAHFYRTSYSGSFTASLGYDRTEYYTVYNSSTKKHEQRSRTVTDWKPYSNSTSGQVTACEYAGDATYNKLADFIDGTGWTSSDVAVPDRSASINTELTKRFKFDHNQTWNDKAGQRCFKKARQNCLLELPPHDRLRNFNVNLKFNINSVKSVLLPHWIYSYDYKGKVYFVVVDGNNPHRIHGQRPVNKARKAAVLSLRWLGWPAGLYASYSLADNFAHGPNYSSSSNGDLKTFGLFIIGFIVTWIIVEGIISVIKKTSQKKRDEKLLKRRSEKMQSALNSGIKE